MRMEMESRVVAGVAVAVFDKITRLLNSFKMKEKKL